MVLRVFVCRRLTANNIPSPRRNYVVRELNTTLVKLFLNVSVDSILSRSGHIM
jgi:hypothetical protein